MLFEENMRCPRPCQLFFLCLVAMYVLFISSTPFRNHEELKDRCSGDYTCTVLSLDNTTLVPHGCNLFLARRFQEQEFALLSASAQEKLRNVELLQYSKDLSCNISISIFLNHMRVWQNVSDTPALVLEDDAVMPSDLCVILSKVLSHIRRHNVTNYIVKLHEHAPFYIYRQWEEVFAIDDYSVRSCRCRPHGGSSSTAAYLLDRHAAQTLLTAAFPLETHVDVFLHNMGCVQRKITLYSVLPSPVRPSLRVSTHMPTLTLDRLRTVVAGELYDWSMGECLWRWMPL